MGGTRVGAAISKARLSEMKYDQWYLGTTDHFCNGQLRPVIGYQPTGRPNPDPRFEVNLAIAGVRSFAPIFCSIAEFEVMIGDGIEMTVDEVNAFMDAEREQSRKEREARN